MTIYIYIYINTGIALQCSSSYKMLLFVICISFQNLQNIDVVVCDLHITPKSAEHYLWKLYSPAIHMYNWVFIFVVCFWQSLGSPESYHEFCRLLFRIKSNYQLGELLRLDDYSKFIELITKFTVSSLQVCTCDYCGQFLLNFYNKV